MSFKPSEIIKKKQNNSFSYKQHLHDKIGADTYNTDIEQFNKDYGADYLSSWHTADEINSYYDRLASITDRTKAYQSYVNLYGTDEQKAVLGDIDKQVKSYSDVLGQRQNVLDYYGRFGNAEGYNNYINSDEYKIGWLNPDSEVTADLSQKRQAKYQSNAARIKELENDPLIIVDKKLKSELERLRAENQKYENEQQKLDSYYTPITEEFKQNAAYRDYINVSGSELFDLNSEEQEIYSLLNNGIGEFDENGNIVNAYNGKVIYSATDLSRAISNNTTADFYNSLVQDKLGMFRSASDEDISTAYDRLGTATGYQDTWAKLIREGDANGWSELTEGEVDIYYDLLKTKGQEAAYKYLSDMTTTLTRRATKKAEENVANAKGWEKFGLNLASIPMNVFGGITSFSDDVTSVIKGENINPYSRSHLFQNIASATRQSTAEDINKLTGNAAIPLIDFTAGDAYQAIMSGADSLLGAALGGTTYGIVMGMGAASATAKDLYEKGATLEQIALGSLAAGAAEMVFEKYSIEKFIEMGDSDTIAKLILNTLKQGGIEASEEALTEIANTITNSIIMGSQSDWKDTGTFIKNVVNSALGGFISGIGMGAVGATSRYVTNKIETDLARLQIGEETIKKNKVEALLKESKTLFKGDNFKKEQRLIADIEKNLDKTDRTQKRNIGKLTESYYTQAFKELNKQVAEKSIENVAETRKNVESEAKKLKVNSSSAEINYDNMPQILGFEGANLDKTMVETEQGAVKLTDMEISNAEIGDLYAYAVRLGSAESANAFIQNWDQTTDPLYYWLDWTKLQTRGLYAPEKMEKAMSDYSDVKLSPAAKLAAFKSGMSLRTSAREKMEADSAKLKETYKELGGKVKKGKFDDSKLNYSALTKEQKDVVNFTKILSDYLGVNITYFKSEKGKRGANGYYSAKNNTIYLDIYAGIGNKESYSAIKDCLVNTVSHEIVHNMAVNAPAEYGALRDFVIERLSEEEGFDLDSRVEQIMLENSDQGFTAEDAIEEIVAMSCEDLLGSSERLQEAMTQFYAKNEKAANSFTKYVREVLNRLKQFFEKIIGKKSIAEESQFMAKQSAEFIAELQKRYDAALLAVREGNAARGAQKAEEKVKEQARKSKDFFIEDKYFKSQMKKWDTLPYGSSVKVGKITGEHPLVKVGMPQGVVKYDVSKLDKNMGKHKYLTPKLLKEIPNIIADPIAISEYTKENNTVSVFGNVFLGSSPMMVGVTIAKDISGVNISKVRTYNARSDAGNLITDENVLYLNEDKKRTRKWFQICGIQVPLEETKFGFIRSISQPETNVNPSGEKTFKQTRRDTEYLDAVTRGDMETAQRMIDEVASDLMPDSKIRTEDGKLRKVFHGTNTGEFTVFNPDYIGMSSGDDGFFGMGFYFAYSKGEASYYGANRVISAYLNLKNPFNFEKELQTYKGKKASSGYAPDAVALMNFADKFPQVAKNVKIGVVENGSDTGKDINISEFSKAFKDVIENKSFEYREVLNEFGEKETVVTADEKTVEYEYGGQKYSYKDYGFQKRFWGTPNELDVAYEYLANSVYEYIDMIPRTRLILDNNKEFTLALKDMGYDGAIQSEYGDEAVAFYPEQIKSADPVTYDDDGNVIPLSERFNETNPDIRYQKRTETPGASEVLSELFRDNPNLNGYADQRKELKSYQELLRSVKVNEQRIAEIDAEIKSLKSQKAQGGKGTRMAQLYEMRKTAEDRAAEKKNRMFKMEATSLRDVVTKETARLLQERTEEERSLSRQKQKEIRENYARREYIKKIEQRAKGLQEALTKNSKDKHIPEPFKAVVADMITALDFSSKSKLKGKGETKKDVKIATAMRELATMMTAQNQKSTGEVQNFLMACDITDDFAQEFMDINNDIAGISEKVSGIAAENELVLQKMTSEQLRRLNSALYKLGNQINAANKLMENNLYKNVNEMGSELMRYAKSFKKKKQAGAIKQMLDTDQLTSYYAFKRMGKVGMSWFDEWADGWDTYSFLSDEIVDTAKTSWTAEEVKKWTNDVHEFTIRGEKFYLTTAHLMSFYLLYKQQDSQRHLNGYGMVVEDFNTDPDINNVTGKKYSNLNTGTYLTTEDITQLLTTLEEDKRAIEVADKIQHFMATTCADWANYVTMRRFGEKAYTIEDYFPIESSDKDMPTKKKDEGVKISLYSLLNKSFTKSRNLKANNKIMIRNVFDVFASHTTEVAAYRALAIPLLDTLKLYNYQTTTEVIENGEVKEDRKSMQEVLADAFGNDFNQYIENLIRDITGANPPQRNTAIEKVANFLVSKTKVASVAFNFRVAALQGTSYIRASAVLNHKYLLKELKDTPQLRRAIKTMNEYSGIAVWKTKLGFRDVNITRSLQEKIKHEETALDKFNDFAMKGAEIGDRLTWGAIWLACEEETKDKRAELSVGSEEFYKAVAKRFREVIYATQVVDSPLAKSQVMRSKSGWTRLMTNFMAEPTVSYNLLLDTYSEVASAKQRGVKLSRQNYLKIGRLVVVYIESQIVQAAVESVVDALRRIANDEEDETLIEAYFDELWRNILQELNVLEKIPYVKTVYGAAEKYLMNGYSYNQTMEIAVFEKLFKSGSDFKKFVEGDISLTKLIKSVLDAVSSMFGIPLSNMYRTVRTIWNNVVEMFNDGSGRIE